MDEANRSSERPREALIGATRMQAQRAAAEVLARIPWDGRRIDPDRMSAARFLSTLPG